MNPPFKHPTNPPPTTPTTLVCPGGCPGGCPGKDPPPPAAFRRACADPAHVQSQPDPPAAPGDVPGLGSHHGRFNSWGAIKVDPQQWTPSSSKLGCNPYQLYPQLIFHAFILSPNWIKNSKSHFYLLHHVLPTK